ncbi:Zinc finger CCCH domain-containing protein 3 [Mactra antiquata]
MADFSENERLRNEIKKLTEAIENAKSKPSWRGRRVDNSLSRSHVGVGSYHRNNFTTSHHRQPVKQAWKQANHNYHPYFGKFAPHKNKETFSLDEFNCEKDFASNSAVSLPKDKDTISVAAPAGKYSSKSSTALYNEISRGAIKNVQLSVDQEHFQQKVEKMKSSIAELQKALKERQLPSAVQQNTNTKQESCCSVYNSEPSKNLKNDNVEKPSSFNLNISHKPTSHVQIPTCPPVKSQCYFKSDNNPKKQKFFSRCDQTENLSKCTYISSKSSNLVSNVDCHNSDSDFVSVSKYKLTRLNSSPIKTNSVHSVRVMTASKPCLEERSDFHHETISKPTSVHPVGKESLPLDSNVSSLLKKSKYSPHWSKGSYGKSTSHKKTLPVKPNSKTPSKFITLSKYAIKRVRRSLSDESTNRSFSSSNTAAKQKLIKPESRFTSHQFKTFDHCSVFKDIKNYKHDLSYKVRNQYMARRSLYKSKYQSPWNQQTHWHEYGNLWKNGYKFNTKTYTNIGRGLSLGYGARSNQASFSRYSSRLVGTKHNARNRYAFKRIQLLKQKIPFNPKHKIDRRTSRPRDENVGFVVINGLLYKSNSKKLVKATVAQSSLKSAERSNKKPVSISSESMATPLKNVNVKDVKTVTVRGVKFKVDKNGKSLKRIMQPDLRKDHTSYISSTRNGGQVARVDIGGVTYMQTKPGTLERVNSVKSRVAAVRVVNKTIHAAGKFKKENRKSPGKRKDCMFYNRFGKCNRKEKCPYIHDPDKIAVCTRFLRGTCKSKDCPFSHKVSENKVPTCSFFIQGKCSRKDCPYPHVNVNKKAAVCDDFLKGFCPSGVKCKKKHILQCPEYFHTGVCSNGKDCKLQHKKTKETKHSKTRQVSSLDNLQENHQTSSDKIDKTISDNSNPVGDNTPETSALNTAETDSTCLLSGKRKLPAYISLKTSIVSSVVPQNDTCKSAKVALKIRPHFL